MVGTLPLATADFRIARGAPNGRSDSVPNYISDGSSDSVNNGIFNVASTVTASPRHSFPNAASLAEALGISPH